MSKESKKSKSSKSAPPQEVHEAVAPGKQAALSSWCDVPGPWETKKISIFGAVRSVVSQLRSGQDMTRVSLPACFLAPFSALELGASKFMGYLHILYELNDETDPLKRFLLVIRWYLACYCELKFNHKPYNPVINESHQCSVQTGGATATFIAEQVSHHPPLSAIRINSPEKNLIVEGNITFAIKFGGNSASCESRGDARVTVNGETYYMSKGMPDVLLTNVVIGTRVTTWNGEVEINCPQTGYRAVLKLDPKNSKSHVLGLVYHDNPSTHETEEKHEKHEPILQFSGHWAEEPVYAESIKPKKEKSGFGFWGNKKSKDHKEAPVVETVKHLVIDTSTHERATLLFPPEHEMEDTDSLLVWKDVSAAIVGDDLSAADVHKQKVEAAQRIRIKGGAQDGHQRRFFSYCTEAQTWKWNGRLYNGESFLGADDSLTQCTSTGAASDNEDSSFDEGSEAVEQTKTK